MSSFGHSFLAVSPILTVPPQPAPQNSLGMSSCHDQEPRFKVTPHASDQGAQQTRPSPLKRPSASRKRSRDEAAVNLSEDEPPIPIEPIEESEEDWIYGEGMVLIKPGSGYVADASSQSGTWVEEKAAEDETRRNAEAAANLEIQRQQERPSLRSYKSQRLEQGSSVRQEESEDATKTLASNPRLPTAAPKLVGDGASQPVVDDFTFHLGIGWRRISDDEHIQAAARGWARYIENHYPISGASIRLESKGLQSYLVEASEGYFLFAEDLRQGRLVSKTAEGALANLKTSPPAFDDPDTLVAADSPKSLETLSGADASHQDDVEMDMS